MKSFASETKCSDFGQCDYPYAAISGDRLTISNGHVFSGYVAYAQNQTITLDQSASLTESCTLIKNDSIINFSSEYNFARHLSWNISQLAATGTTAFATNQMTLTGTNTNGVEKFDVAAAQFGSIQIINLVNINANCLAIVINIDSSANQFKVVFPELSYSNIFTSVQSKLIWNLWNAKSVEMDQIGLVGTLLAPDANVENPTGSLLGNAIAMNWSGPMQINAMQSDSYCWPSLTAGMNFPAIPSGAAPTSAFQARKIKPKRRMR